MKDAISSGFGRLLDMFSLVIPIGLALFLVCSPPLASAAGEGKSRNSELEVYAAVAAPWDLHAQVSQFEINAGLNDAWYNPATDGQGFFVIVFPVIHKMFLSWFTYDIERPPGNVTALLGDPGHRWLTAIGDYSGDTAVLTIDLTQGGVFDSHDPVPSHQPYGTITVTFTDCHTGEVSYDIPSASQTGVVPIQRIANDNVPLCQSLAAHGQQAAIDVGDFTVCAVGADGEAWCWGPNGYGELGTGDTVQGNVPRRAAEGYAFKKVSVSTGGAYTCGITTTGQAYCWGNQEGGRLGDGTMAPSGQFVTAPVPVSGGHTFTDIAVGGDHACAIATGGAAYCWGHNERGQHGTGNNQNSAVPAAVTGGLSFTSITTHQMVTCGIAVDGAGYCWGNGEAGNLGSGSKSSSNVPVQIKGGLKFSSLQLGVWTACGVTTDGDGYCWGWNGSGELGIGSKNPQEPLEPLKVVGGHKWKSISPGVAVTCGVATDGRGFCWGGNTFGERGDGPFPSPDVTSPVPVAGNLVFQSIDSDWVTCGVATEIFYCWGSGSEGSIGDGAQVHRGIPTKVAGQP